MNIFMTHSNPIQCAREHCLIHQNKMIIEYAQLLSTAHHVADSWNPGMYKPTHVNHPSAKWARESQSNYEWLLSCWQALCVNYFDRAYKHHKTYALNAELIVCPPLPDVGLTPLKQAMPDIYKQDDGCLAYQSYLNAKFKEWKARAKPLRVRFQYEKPEWLEIWYVKD